MFSFIHVLSIFLHIPNSFYVNFQMFFEDNIDDAKYCGHLYGLGTTFVINGNSFIDNGDNHNGSQ